MLLMDDFLERWVSTFPTPTTFYLEFYRFSDTVDCTSGECQLSFTRVREGLIVSLLSIGTLSGALFGAPLADYLGRRWAMCIESIVVTIGFIVQITTFTVWQQIAVGRFISGLGVVRSQQPSQCTCQSVSLLLSEVQLSLVTNS